MDEPLDPLSPDDNYPDDSGLDPDPRGKDHNTIYGLVVPFLNESSDFAHGVEVGMLFQRMKVPEPIIDYFLLDNQESILLMVNRLDWKVQMLRTEGQYFYAELLPPGFTPRWPKAPGVEGGGGEAGGTGGEAATL